MSFLFIFFTEMNCLCLWPSLVLTANLTYRYGPQGFVLLNMIDGYHWRGTCCVHLEDPDHNMHLHHLSSLRYSVFICIVLDLPGGL